MTKDEALDLALEELENCADLLKVFEAPLDSCVGAAMLGAEKAITAIKQALAAPVPQREVIKELADQYARECVEFAKAIAEGAHSMSPIAVKSGDTRLELHTAIDAITITPAVQLTISAPPAAQRQCTWPTCQSEEYQQALAEQINQELVTGAAQPAPDYAWPTVADYEKDVGFEVNEAFKMAWAMARTTNALFT
jgi:hypothetical protein